MLVIRIYFKVLDSSAFFSFKCTYEYICLLWQDRFDYGLFKLKKIPKPKLIKDTIIMVFKKEVHYIWIIFLNNNMI